MKFCWQKSYGDFILSEAYDVEVKVTQKAKVSFTSW